MDPSKNPGAAAQTTTALQKCTGSFVGALAFVAAIALVGAFSYIFILGDVHRIEIRSAT